MPTIDMTLPEAPTSGASPADVTVTSGPTYTPVGWACPKCHGVMAPWAAQCVNCKPQSAITPQPTWQSPPFSPYGGFVVTADQFDK